MELEIKKTVNGYHVKDADDGELCFETKEMLSQYLCGFYPKNVGDEIKITD